MAEKERMKLCPHCEGQVSIHFDACPFCGGSIAIETGESEPAYKAPYDIRIKNLSPEETLASLYPPPYQSKVFDRNLETDNPFEKEEPLIEEAAEPEAEISSLWPTLCLSLGMLLLLISFLLLVFSDKGELVIRWNADLWYAYFIPAMPLLFLGYRLLDKFK